MSRIIHKKILTTRRPVAKILIKYNSICSKKNDEKVKEPIDTELTDQNTDPYNDENAIDFKWSCVKEEEDEEDIALAKFSESLQKQVDEEIFPKK